MRSDDQVPGRLSPAKRYPVIIPMYLALVVDPLYAYFFFQAAQKGVDDLFKSYAIETSDGSRMAIAASLILGTVCQTIQQMVATNPAEAVGYFYQKRRKAALSSRDDRLPDPVKVGVSVCRVPTILFAYFSFAVSSLSSTIPISEWMVGEPGRWAINIPLIALGLVFYYLLSHQDLMQHNDWIYGLLFDKSRSIFLSAVQSPMESLEVLLEMLSNMLYRGFSMAYVMQAFILTNDFIDANTTRTNATTGPVSSKALGVSLPWMVTAFMTTVYMVLFTRLRGPQRHFFIEGREAFTFKQCLATKINPLPVIRDVVLSNIRNAGIVYFVVKVLQFDLPLAGGVSAIVGLALFLHALAVHFRRESADHLIKIDGGYAPLMPQLQENTGSVGTVIKVFAALIVGLTRFVRWVAFLGFLLSLNDFMFSLGYPTNFEATDILSLAGAIGVPIAVNEFRYYNGKLIENLEIYTKKIEAEKRQRGFGCACLFHGWPEYPQKNHGGRLSVND